MAAIEAWARNLPLKAKHGQGTGGKCLEVDVNRRQLHLHYMDILFGMVIYSIYIYIHMPYNL